MKTIYLLIFLAFAGTLLVTCNNDKEESTPTATETTPWKAGQLLTYSFIADDDTVVKMRDEVLDYGFTNFPVLMLVHKETLIQKEGWGSVFHPLKKEKLEFILALWAQEFKMNYVTPQDKAYVARNFLDYIVSYKLDVGLFVDLILGGQGLKLEPMMEMISSIEKAGKSPNDYLYRMLSENISREKIMGELKSGEQSMFMIMMFCTNIVMSVTKFVMIFTENKKVENFSQNYMSFVCSEDTVLSHYTGGTPFISRTYKLSYDAGLWEAKCKYHLEGTYNAVTPACSGKFLTHCNTIPDTVHVKGPGFIVDGKVSYSPPINTGGPGNLIPSLNGQVMVTYGDCCCFRKFSVLNFKIDGGSGYLETTFDPGK